MMVRWGEGRERRGVLTGEQFGKGRSSREVWLQAKVYLYVSEVLEMKPGRQENQFFLWITHDLQQQLSRRDPWSALPLTHRRQKASTVTDWRHSWAWEWESTTKWEQLLYVHNHRHTRWNSVLRPTRSRNANRSSVSGMGSDFQVTQSLLKVDKSVEALTRSYQPVRFVLGPRWSCWLPLTPTHLNSTMNICNYLYSRKQ